MKCPHLSTIIPMLVLIVRTEGQTETLSCGRPKLKLFPLMTHSLTAYYWPWHAAIFHRDETPDPSYKCGGTVISSTSILTAAHCVSKHNKVMETRLVSVSIGRLNLSVNETTAQWFEVVEIIIHPNYTDIEHRNDIAVIRLSSEVKFNNYVQPVCLWNARKNDLSEIVGRSGTVVGWGNTQTENPSYVLQHASMPVISSMACLTSNPSFFGPYLSETSFCAGFQNGTSVCLGDSGGSLTVEENGMYYIRGIVSVGSATVNHTTQRIKCDSMQYALFTDVAQYLPWLAPYAFAWDIEVRCEPDFLRWDECRINLFNNHSERVAKIYLNELEIASVFRLNVTGESRVFPDLSDAIPKLPNLFSICMRNTKLVILKRAELTAFDTTITTIMELLLDFNQITQLDADTFNDLLALRVLNLSHNQLTELPHDVFKKLIFLQFLALNNNKLESLPEDLFQRNSRLKQITLHHNQIKQLHVNLFVGLRDLAELSLNHNQLKTLDSEIFLYSGKLQKVDVSGNKNMGSEYRNIYFRGNV